MIVFDVSALVSAALKIDSTPERAFFQAAGSDVFALSDAVWEELVEVFERPKIKTRTSAARRELITRLLLKQASWFAPNVRVTDCRDPTDDVYLELALAARATVLVTGDKDLLALHPWRGVHILAPTQYLAQWLSLP